MQTGSLVVHIDYRYTTSVDIDTHRYTDTRIIRIHFHFLWVFFSLVVCISIPQTISSLNISLFSFFFLSVCYVVHCELVSFILLLNSWRQSLLIASRICQCQPNANKRIIIRHWNILSYDLVTHTVHTKYIIRINLYHVGCRRMYYSTNTAFYVIDV